MPADDFKVIFRGHPSLVAVITADAGDGPVALAVSSLASVSPEPPLLVFSVSGFLSSSAVHSRAQCIVVHSLNRQDLDVAQLGATGGIDRYAQPQTWTKLATGKSSTTL